MDTTNIGTHYSGLVHVGAIKKVTPPPPLIPQPSLEFGCRLGVAAKRLQGIGRAWI